jgi:hypothetical protein
MTPAPPRSSKASPRKAPCRSSSHSASPPTAGAAEWRSNGQALSPRCAGKEGISGQRLSAIEDNLYALAHSAHSDDIETENPEIHAALTAAKVCQEESKQLQLLTLYEQRINRNIQKNLATLQALQAARIVKREAEMKEAKKLLQLSEMKGLAYEPGKHGFVFSTAQIHAGIDTERRLQRANLTDFSRYNPQRLHAQAA